MNTPCPRCQQTTLIITTQQDSNYKIVSCQSCGWWTWLKYYNKLTKTIC